jgi:hypothetical protein
VTRPEFEALLKRLAGLRYLPSDLDTHWLGLQEVPFVVLEAAVRRAAATRSQFPTPAELREDCDAVRSLVPALEAPVAPVIALEVPLTLELPHRLTPLTVTHVHTYHCELCSDTGWLPRWCDPCPGRRPWEHEGRCTRSHETGDGHGSYVEVCRCRATNPVLQAARAGQSRYVAERPTRPDRFR